MQRIVLLSDTHNHLDQRIFSHLEKSDQIWHAGDIGDISITDKLQEFAPIKVVYGNIDNYKIRQEFKRSLCFRCEEVKVLMTHIGGYPGRYPTEVKELIIKNNPKIFISGHSHILKIIYDKKFNLLHLNPGSIGNYGFHKVKTLITFKINGDKIYDLKIIEYKR
tara:strand:+ start:15 stop:506 length:492 start_codon:yes stop_codon:yes gene_type:complete